MKNSRLLGSLATVSLIAAAVGAVFGAREEGRFVQTRGAPATTAGNSMPSTSKSTIAKPSPSTVGPNTTGSVGAQPLSENVSTARPLAPWQVSATSGLTNLAPVTITATGVPPGSYYVGQCPAGVTPSLAACALNDVVTATDGTLTSTVHVFWWLEEGRIDCGSAPGACVVGAMNARTAVTVASFAIAFDPARRPTITVTPTDSLTDGQSVVVRGVDIGEGTVRINQCVLPGEPVCTVLETPSGPDGSFTTAMTVRRVLEWISRSGPTSATCGVDGDCAVEAWIVPQGLDSQRIRINPNAPIGLHFAPVPATTATATPVTTDALVAFADPAASASRVC